MVIFWELVIVYICIALNDTETSFHTLFPTEKKSLAFMSSLFLPYYTFWKDDAKGKILVLIREWSAVALQLSRHNSNFCCLVQLRKIVGKERFSPNGNKKASTKDFQLRQLPPRWLICKPGVKINLKKREMFRHSLEQAANSVEAAIFAATGTE